MIKEITILGRRMSIKHVTKPELKEIYPDPAEEILGWFSPSENCIYLWSGLEKDSYRRVLLHEITHAYMAVSGLSNLLSDEQEEAISDLFESFVEQFNNKKLVEELTE
mgnify:CR=1 FL=1